jgi:peptidoglycan/LPS O-acetylase OafA/YrhL
MAAIILFYVSTAPVDSVSARIYNPRAIITNLLMLHSCGFHDIFTWNVPSWSISAEWWAYMVFPFLALLLSKNKIVGLFVIGLLAVSLYFSIVFILPRINPFAPNIPNLNHDLDVTYDFGYLRGIAGFMMGMLVYAAYQNKKISQLFSKDSIGAFSIIVLITLMHFGVNDLVYIPFLMLLVLSFSANEGFLAKICSLKTFQYLGDISYSIYMVHALFIFYAIDNFLKILGITFKDNEAHEVPFYTGLLACILFLLMIIIVSSITYYLIEKPCRRWLNKKLA